MSHIKTEDIEYLFRLYFSTTGFNFKIYLLSISFTKKLAGHQRDYPIEIIEGRPSKT